MNFEKDFIKYFGEVEIVHKTPEKMLQEQKSSTKYDVMYFQGAWTSQTAGGCGNDSIGKRLYIIYILFLLTYIILSFSKLCEKPTVYVHSL